MGNRGRPRKLQNPKFVGFWLEREEFEVLKAIARMRRMSVSEFIRMAIKPYLVAIPIITSDDSGELKKLDETRQQVNSIFDRVIEIKIRESLPTLRGLLRALERGVKDEEVVERFMKILTSVSSMMQRMLNPPPDLVEEVREIVLKAQKSLSKDVTYVT